MEKRGVVLALVVAGLVGGGLMRLQPEKRVGDVTPEGTVVASGRIVNAKPEDGSVGPVVDAAFQEDGSYLIKSSGSLTLVDPVHGQLVLHKAGMSLTGLDARPYLHEAIWSDASHSLTLSYIEAHAHGFTGIELPEAQVGGPCYPCGVVFSDADHALVAASRDNSILKVNLETSKVERRFPVDVAPYRILLTDPHHALVTCWGVAPTPPGDSAPASGTPVQVDKRGIATRASICRLDLDSGQLERAYTPLQPTEMALDGPHLYVACANGDTVLRMDKRTLKIDRELRVGEASGAAPNSLAVDGKKHRLYAAFGGLDLVAAFDLRTGRLLGVIKTGWYPSVVRVGAPGLLIGTAKGFGSRLGTPGKWSVNSLSGTVVILRDPVLEAPAQEILSPGPRKGIAAVPVPARVGEPSLIKHVVYVIKENRTYDQILGDMSEGDGDKDLVLYGENVTPNHHAIARNWVLLDNYYCNGVISSDGHAWATEGNATTYYERSRGGWTRSYPFGDDPLATSNSGYIWDDALDHRRTVMNFGEFDYAAPEAGRTAAKIYRKFVAGEHETFRQNIGVARLRAVSERDFPGWNLAIPDVLRADRFITRLHDLEARGDMADLTILYLPQDHTSGGRSGYPSPRAQVADNDLGLGKCVEALSKSRFWATTAVFIEEDDPQDGFDHVDGHRSPCLIASPYARRGVVVSRFYNQASVLHTIERILGLPPMNLNDGEASVMDECFTSSPDLTPYQAVPNRIPLDEKLPPGTDNVSFRLDKPDSVDDDKFNRRLWKLAGKALPYPGR